MFRGLISVWTGGALSRAGSSGSVHKAMQRSVLEERGKGWEGRGGVRKEDTGNVLAIDDDGTRQQRSPGKVGEIAGQSGGIWRIQCGCGSLERSENC